MATKSNSLKIKANKALNALIVIGIIGVAGFVLRWQPVADAVAGAIGKPELSGKISLYADTATGVSIGSILVFVAYLVAGSPLLAVMLGGLGLITLFFTLKKVL